MKEFKINNCLKLKLIGRETVIYVARKRFIECKFLLINIPIEEVSSFDKIESIDEASERLDKSMEKDFKRNLDISPYDEFWAHCSNLQVWAEQDYDTRLLHRNLAFPLLKELVDAGDLKAKQVFREEIAMRMESGDLKVNLFLLEENYIKYLEQGELELLFYDSNKKLRKNIESALTSENSSRNYALLVLKELAELGDLVAKRITIEEFHKQLKEDNLSEHDLLVRDGYYEYLDRKTMLFTLLEKTDAEVILKLDQLMDKRWLEFKAELDNVTVENYPDSYRKELFLKPTLFNGLLGEDREKYSFLVENKRIVDLDLRPSSDFKLIEFPEPISDLTALQNLDLSFNTLTKIPKSILALRDLKVLNLEFSNIKLLPESIGELESLEKLKLEVNKIQKLPKSIGKLKYLRTLKLDNNNLKTIPDSIGNLVLLEILSLYGNELEILPESIASLASLYRLDISHTKLSSLPEAVLNLTTLKVVNIDSSQIDLYPLQILKKKGVRISTN